jgi:hypothetical protein
LVLSAAAGILTEEYVLLALAGVQSPKARLAVYKLPVTVSGEILIFGVSPVVTTGESIPVMPSVTTSAFQPSLVSRSDTVLGLHGLVTYWLCI